MFDLDTEEKILLIKQTELDDAKILSDNYKLLANSADNPEDQAKFAILRTSAKLRIKELTKK